MKKISLCMMLLILFIVTLFTNKIKALELSNEEINTQILEIVDKSKSTYAYDSLSKLQNGTDYQKFYDYAFNVVCEFMIDYESTGEFINEHSTIYYIISLDQNNCDFEYIENLNSTEVFYILKALYLDNPIFYWLHYNFKRLYCYDNLIYIDIYESYYDPTIRRDYNIKIIEEVKRYTDIVENIGSEYTIAKVLQTEIANNMTYEYINGIPSQTDYAHNILGLFVYNTGVCETYAQTFQLLLQYSGVECIQVHGNKGRDHAWNMAKMNNGQWYGFDLTNDDLDNVGAAVVFSDFCSADDDFKAIHRPYDPFINTFDSGRFYDIPNFSISEENMEEYYTISKDGITYKIYYDKLIPIKKDSPDLKLHDNILFYNTNYTIMCLHDNITMKDNCDYCNFCDTTLHSFKKINGKDSSCSEEGYTEKIYCTKCNKIIQESLKLPKLDHKESEWIIANEPTEKIDGYKYKECLECYEIIEEEFIPKLNVTNNKNNKNHIIIIISGTLILIICGISLSLLIKRRKNK